MYIMYLVIKKLYLGSYLQIKFISLYFEFRMGMSLLEIKLLEKNYSCLFVFLVVNVK